MEYKHYVLAFEYEEGIKKLSRFNIFSNIKLEELNLSSGMLHKAYKDMQSLGIKTRVPEFIGYICTMWVILMLYDNACEKNKVKKKWEAHEAKYPHVFRVMLRYCYKHERNLDKCLFDHEANFETLINEKNRRNLRSLIIEKISKVFITEMDR